MPTADQYAGCLVGHALGDAMGFIVEGQEPTVTGNFVAKTVREGRIERARRGQFDFGQYSDDTQLVREMLRGFVAWDGVFDAKDYAGRIARFFQFDLAVGRDRATEAAAERMNAGTPWQEAGGPGAGNGATVRAVGVGLMFPDDPLQRTRAAVDQGLSTHADNVSRAGAVTVAGAVALALKGAGDDAASFLNQLSMSAGAFDATLADGLVRLKDWIGIPPDQAAAYISRVGKTPDERDMWPGIAPQVIPTVLWSLYAYLRAPHSWTEPVYTAIAAGGDTDTTAAIAGALAGARNGVSALPRAEAGKLIDQGEWGLVALMDLAHHVHALAYAGGS